ncbi:hypothetical protein CC80DRAFT_543286 [Byssothecium circinans]|uniref:Uncharacterized protein n=1 Tax=Byssothecium circinans TaxID=147558 RepID=A0A6A5UAH6_9PLEO|nr:hypothetical protein CC80DRAFT_543286 [Byssothecium circinans]
MPPSKPTQSPKPDPHIYIILRQELISIPNAPTPTSPSSISPHTLPSLSTPPQSTQPQPAQHYERTHFLYALPTLGAAVTRLNHLVNELRYDPDSPNRDFTYFEQAPGDNLPGYWVWGERMHGFSDGRREIEGKFWVERCVWEGGS